jgi:ABC-2 type transport system ATP-binding protein
MIEFEQVSKRFGAQHALDQVSFRVERGELVGFVGPNGAGKSTALRILTGLVFRTSGRVAVAGRDPGREPVAVCRGLSYLPGASSIHNTGRACCVS